MIDKKIFSDIKTEIENYDKLREEIIAQSRIVLKFSKLLIYAIHREKDIDINLKNVKAEKLKLDKIAQKNCKIYDEGSYSEAVQEYCEALMYYNFIKNGKLVTPKELNVNSNDYLLGLCDLTGELERKTVKAAIDKDYELIKKIKEFVDELFNEFLKFDLRNGLLRKKSDSIKWNLKKIEEVLYDINIKNGRSIKTD